MARTKRSASLVTRGELAHAGAAVALKQRHEDELAVLVAQRHEQVAARVKLARELAHGAGDELLVHTAPNGSQGQTDVVRDYPLGAPPRNRR